MSFRDYDTRLAAYAVIVDDDDRVLLALWNEGDEPLWTMPGGGVELHETPEQAAVRELREETGYLVELTGLLGVDTYVLPPERRRIQTSRPLKAVRIVYAARIVGGQLTDEQNGTTDEARWVPVTEVPALPQVSLVGIAMTMRADRPSA
ncbi:MAG TPA: NUDIX domain-containing protein [Dermatophilaceae bacterium]|nr:NUDIX domain-containing protein [Dermatophilaceae bacterium]